jgi:hypothetical protein
MHRGDHDERLEAWEAAAKAYSNYSPEDCRALKHGHRSWRFLEQNFPDWRSRKEFPDLKAQALEFERQYRDAFLGSPEDVERFALRLSRSFRKRQFTLPQLILIAWRKIYDQAGGSWMPTKGEVRSYIEAMKDVPRFTPRSWRFLFS